MVAKNNKPAITVNDNQVDFSAHYKDAKKVAENFAKDVKFKAVEVKDQLTENLKDQSQKLKEKATEQTDKIRNYTVENPWKALGIGAAVGFMLAKVLRLFK